MAKAPKKPRIEVAEILRVYGDEYRHTHQASAKQITVMRHIQSCRTAVLGGHKDTCDSCGHIRISYNSCRDRHCPKCQNLKRAEWLETRKERLLPIPYFHVVFTLPNQLNPLVLRNKRILLNLLFETAADTLQTMAKDKKHLGAQVGFTAILHTWGQNLLFHPHLHCVVTGGGLSSNGEQWVRGSRKFFLPVKAMSRLYRGKFLHALKKAYREERLCLKGSTQTLQNPSTWKSLLDALYRIDWVIYAKPPFGGPDHVFHYLGRYTHRVAISNHRLLALRNGKVRFLIRDYTEGGKKKVLALQAVEFIRRFLLHVLPKKFIRIRHYGLMAARNLHKKFLMARRLLGLFDPPSNSSSPSLAQRPWWERLLMLTRVDIMACPACGKGRLQRLPMRPWAGQSEYPPCRAAFDTS
jgi:hypothetical protein